MKIIEKINKTQYIGKKETGIYTGTRYIIDSDEELNIEDTISSNNPIKGKFQTLCELCAKVYNGGEDYSEAMKQQAIDYHCGFIKEIINLN